MKIRSYPSGRLRPHVLPVLVWLGALAGVVILFHHRSLRFEVLGMAQGQVRQIAATCTGRLKSVPVELFQEVREGDPIAIIDTVLDNEHLEAELSAASAEIKRLSAELEATRDRLIAEATNIETDRIASQRRFYVDVENARLRVLELKATIETDRMMLEDLKLNSKIYAAQNILDQNDTVYYERRKIKVEYNVLVRKIEENQRLLAQEENDLKQTHQRRDEFARRQPQLPSIDRVLEVVRRAINVQERQVDALLARREPLILKAPIDGVVSQILRRPVRRTGEGVVRQMIRRSGEAVEAGEPILTISATRPSEIIAYVSGEQLGQIQKGVKVEVIKENEPVQMGRSKVTYFGPIMEVMPQQLWMAPDIPQWGRPMLIEIPPGLKLIPGEIVGIKVL
jgi:multidrug resistance efflux pump